MAIIDGSSERRNRRPQDWCLRKMRELFSMTMGSRVAETAMLTDDAKLGERFLCWGETVLLLRSLTGLQHSKKNFKARSFKIQNILAKLLKMFTTKLEDANTKEKKTQATFDKCMESKGAELTAAEAALGKDGNKNGALETFKAETKEAIDMFTPQKKPKRLTQNKSSRCRMRWQRKKTESKEHQGLRM